MDLRQMRSFERVARLGSIRQAARALYIAQPALSRQIAALERELGGQLFDRSGHGVVLTTAGHRLLAHVDRVLDELGKLDADMGYFLGRRRGQIKLCVTSTLAECVLPAVLPAFVADHPALEILVERTDWSDVIEDVAEGRVDAAVANIPTLSRRVREEHLFDDDLVVVTPPGDAWAGRREVTLRELASTPLILPTRGRWFSDIVSPLLKQADLEFNIRFELSGYAAIMQLVRAGVAVAFVPLCTVDGSLPVMRLVEPAVSRTLGWLEPAAPQAQPALADLKDAIRAHLESLRRAALEGSAESAPVSAR